MSNDKKLILPGTPEWMQAVEIGGVPMSEMHEKIFNGISDPNGSQFDNYEGLEIASCEKPYSTLDMYNAWLQGVRDSEPDYPHDDGFNMLHELWIPKWKWFKPPMWKIFRWAYNIKRTLYTGCYPVSMSTGVPTTTDVSFDYKPYQPGEKISEFIENYKREFPESFGLSNTKKEE